MWRWEDLTLAPRVHEAKALACKWLPGKPHQGNLKEGNKYKPRREGRPEPKTRRDRVHNGMQMATIFSPPFGCTNSQ